LFNQPYSTIIYICFPNFHSLKSQKTVSQDSKIRQLFYHFAQQYLRKEFVLRHVFANKKGTTLVVP